MWNLLKESPDRREIYEKITNGNVYPLPYCKTRWCENEQTFEPAAEIRLKYCKFVKYLMTLPHQRTTKLWSPVPLVCAKLKFAEMLS